jgi:putative Mg2+ transporter-C (MgtC) family protein
MEPVELVDVLLRLSAAAAAGLVIGFEREWREKAAGLRTLTLVSTGSALFALAAVVALPEEAVRMSAGIATGVGFLGAGVILREQGEVTGLTTAATVWIAAALGIVAAAGAFTLLAFGTALALVILIVLSLVDFAAVQQDTRVYEVVYTGPEWDEDAAGRVLSDAGLLTVLLGLTWSAEGVSAVWRVVGRRERHRRGIDALRGSADVKSFTMRT